MKGGPKSSLRPFLHRALQLSVVFHFPKFHFPSFSFFSIVFT